METNFLNFKGATKLYPQHKKQNGKNQSSVEFREAQPTKYDNMDPLYYHPIKLQEIKKKKPDTVPEKTTAGNLDVNA